LCDQKWQPAPEIGPRGNSLAAGPLQPNYKPVVKWRRILAKGALATGAARKKAIVAVARQLAVDFWRIRTGRIGAEQLGLSN
jgi:hypothetical protein